MTPAGKRNREFDLFGQEGHILGRLARCASWEGYNRRPSSMEGVPADRFINL